MEDFKLDCAGRGLCAKGCGRQDKQLNTYDWLAGVPGNVEETDLVEVQFKNTRKGYYHNNNALPIEKGDTVAVEASPGHDIGVVTLTGRLVTLQLKKACLKSADEIKRIYRKAKPVDMEKYEEAKAKEYDTMIQSRQIAKNLGLNMKIGDVEYQGDGNKAIFYYIAEGRVDFRQLIKVLAETFHVRIEMKQIGARQEAGRIGGIGPCGRELCCATWMKNFVSVSTSSARLQDISLNPQKLAGQCAKLKCCMNYEADVYMEASKRLPSREVVLQTKDADFYFFKADTLAGVVTYSSDKRMAANLVTLTNSRIFEVIEMNKRGEKPEMLQEEVEAAPQHVDLAEQESLTRFDKRKKKRRPNDRRDNRPPRDRKEGASNNNAQVAAPQNAEAPARNERRRGDENRRRDNNRGDNRERRESRPPRDNNNTRERRDNRPPRRERPQGNRPPQGNGGNNNKNNVTPDSQTQSKTAEPNA